MNPFLTNKDIYSIPQNEKESFLLSKLKDICEFHSKNCSEYSRFFNHFPKAESLAEVPFLPVGIFKEFDLVSHPKEDISVVVKSSATTSGTPSKVYVDKETAKYQKLSVFNIFSDYIGNKARPYIIFDTRKTAVGSGISARGAALMSLMGHASKFFFVMDDNQGILTLNRDLLQEALDYAKKGCGSFIAYGFTYILYQAHLEIVKLGLDLKKDWNHKETFFLHSGGWKKLTSMAVEKVDYNKMISDLWGLNEQNVIDFYGMAEQVGIVYPDCEAGFKHVPYFADIIVRDQITLNPVPQGQIGLIQLISLLGQGGPSHSVLTEDLGEQVCNDNCSCGRLGKAFRFKGRVKKAEVRGCGDIYSTQ